MKMNSQTMAALSTAERRERREGPVIPQSEVGASSVEESKKWYRAITKALMEIAEPQTLEAALLSMLPLFEKRGWTADDVFAHAQECVQEMQAKLPKMQDGTEINVQHAACIRSYTDGDLAPYREMSGALHDGTRLVDGEVSETVKLVLPFLKLLNVALEGLPASYHYEGQVFRGVKWAFPCLENHNPRQYFHTGRKLWWYEPKSMSWDPKVMESECFAGSSGARTIFKVHATLAYKIENFSDFMEEREVVMPMLSRFKVEGACSKLDLDDSGLEDPLDSRHKGEPDVVELQQLPEDGEFSDTSPVCNSTCSTPGVSPLPAVAQKPLTRSNLAKMTQTLASVSKVWPNVMADGDCNIRVNQDHPIPPPGHSVVDTSSMPCLSSRASSTITLSRASSISVRSPIRDRTPLPTEVLDKALDRLIKLVPPALLADVNCWDSIHGSHICG